MTHEYLVRRTIYVAKCEECGEQDVKDDNQPRERFCMKCGIWVPYIAQSYTGPPLSDKKRGGK